MKIFKQHNYLGKSFIVQCEQRNIEVKLEANYLVAESEKLENHEEITLQQFKKEFIFDLLKALLIDSALDKLKKIFKF